MLRSGGQSTAAFEQSVVPWHPAAECTLCHAKKSFIGKFPCCRLCGNAVCEVETCSNLIQLEEMGKLVNVLTPGKAPAFQSQRDAVVAVCTSCEKTIQAAGRKAQIA